MKGRMYDPGLRQVLTPDPLASAATNSGIHPYAYVMNDPVNFFDPTGFSACDVGTCDVFGSFSADPGPGGHYGWAYTGSWDTQTHNVDDYDWRWIENSRNVPINASSAQLFGGGGATFHGALGLSVTAGSHDDSRVSGATQSSTFSAAQLNTAQTALGAVSMVPGVVGAVAGGIAAGLFVYQGDYGLAAITAAGAIATVVGLGWAVKGGLASGKLGQAFASIGRYFGGGKAAASGAGTLTATERAQIQSIAKKFNTEIHVVGSRAAGKGRNVASNLPVGKGPGTRSDIDFIIDGQADINARGALTDALRSVGNGAGSVISPRGFSSSPNIIFRP